jgi:hypothetical protein
MNSNATLKLCSADIEGGDHMSSVLKTGELAMNGVRFN